VQPGASRPSERCRTSRYRKRQGLRLGRDRIAFCARGTARAARSSRPRTATSTERRGATSPAGVESGLWTRTARRPGSGRCAWP